MLARYRAELYYACAPLSASALRLDVPGPVKLRTRAVGLKRGTDGWMTSLLARLPMSAADAGDADAEQYLSCLSGALADGRIVGDEARALARLAGSAGLGSAQVASLNQRFLESMREAALADDILTAAELTQLQTASNALGMHDYFDDLAVTQSSEP
jgi:DNA polymerase-3 subunit epsilon